MLPSMHTANLHCVPCMYRLSSWLSYQCRPQPRLLRIKAHRDGMVTRTTGNRGQPTMQLPAVRRIDTVAYA